MLVFGKGEGTDTPQGTPKRTKEYTLRGLLLAALSVTATLVFAPAGLAQECPAGTQPFSPSGSGDHIECVSNQWLGDYLRASGDGMPSSPSATASATPTATATDTATATSSGTASAASAAGGTLPDTGGLTSPMVGIGALMLLAGAGIVSGAVVRRS
jgi:hypothetical protein